MQHCGGMNYKLIDVARASIRSRAGKNDREDEGKIHPQRLLDYSIQENGKPDTEADDIERIR